MDDDELARRIVALAEKRDETDTHEFVEAVLDLVEKLLVTRALNKHRRPQ